MQKQQMNIDLTKCETVFCACGSEFWQTVTVSKRVPGLMVGSTQDTLAQIDVLRCVECKKLMPEAEKIIHPPKPQFKIN